MRKLLVIVMLLLLPTVCQAQEYTANVWASFASIAAGTQTTWIFPFKSRTVTIMNGSAVPVCVSFVQGTTANNINVDCTNTISNQGATGDNRVFRIPNAQWITLNNIVVSGINLRSSSGAASPVSVVVDY